MSRLIEALRKAEEEKHKEQSKEKPATDPVDLGVYKASPTATETKATHSIDFELEPVEESPTETTHETYTETNSDHVSIQDEGLSQSINETEEQNREETYHTEPPEDVQTYSRRQSDTPLEIVIHEEEKEEKAWKKPILFWLLTIALILFITSIIYLFFFKSTNANQYSNNLNYSQNRGFLGENNITDSSKISNKTEQASQPSLQKISPEVEDNSLLQKAQSITKGAVSTISGNTSETISAVGTLLNVDNLTSNSELDPNKEQDVPVFQIKRSKPVEGISSSLAYAQDNAQGGEHNAARMEYEELLRNQPTNRNALLGLAQIETATENTETAKEYYLKLLQLEPLDPIAQLGLLENTQNNDLTAFESGLRGLVSDHPSHAFIAFKLGNFYATQGRWSEAKQSFKQALKTSQNINNGAVNPDYAFNLAVALEKTQQPKLALEKYLEAKKLSIAISPSFDVDILNSRIASLEKSL